MGAANTADAGRPEAGPEPSSPDSPRLDRELRELLEEIRVLLPGVQVLLAFLLTVSFSAQFQETGGAEQVIFFVAFVATTVSTILLMVPSVWHRLRWRQGDKEALLETSNRAAICGTVTVGIAVISVVVLVAERVYGWWSSIAVALSIATAMVVLWYVIPLRRDARRNATHDATHPPGS